MKEYNTYIFDLDGTLLNTLGDLAASTNYALRWAGMPEHTTDDVRRFVGNGVKKLMERAIPDGLDNPLLKKLMRCSGIITWHTVLTLPVLIQVSSRRLPNCSKEVKEWR